MTIVDMDVVLHHPVARVTIDLAPDLIPALEVVIDMEVVVVAAVPVPVNVIVVSVLILVLVHHLVHDIALFLALVPLPVLAIGLDLLAHLLAQGFNAVGVLDPFLDLVLNLLVLVPDPVPNLLLHVRTII